MTEQSDREMLELAAKAARIPVVWNEECECFIRTDRVGTCPWMPLYDDGDALRLAMKLAERFPGAFFNLSISKTHDRRGFASAGFASCVNPSESVVTIDVGVATRFVITHAAAAFAGREK